VQDRNASVPAERGNVPSRGRGEHDALVLFACSACGPRLATFATAKVLCTCGRWCAHDEDCCCPACLCPRAVA
jgi:hypothetical protein